jgi:hypothetical protein
LDDFVEPTLPQVRVAEEEGVVLARTLRMLLPEE